MGIYLDKYRTLRKCPVRQESDASKLSYVPHICISAEEARNKREEEDDLKSILYFLVQFFSHHIKHTIHT